MKNFMNTVQIKKPGKSLFDLSHDVKMTGNMGFLMPIMVQECLPGDKFKIGCQSLIRLLPMIAPPLHRYNVTMDYWFVPNRILWPNWENFITNTKVGGFIPAHPYINISDTTWGTPMGTNNPGSLADYLGIPVPFTGSNRNVSAFPFAAYQKLYNDRYRDENLVPEVDWLLADGANAASDFNLLRKRAWQHDYFTSCLPFAQKGDSVNIPIAGFNDVPVRTRTGAPGATTLDGTPADVAVQADTPSGGFSDEIFALTSDLQAQAATINDLRTAFATQRWLEINARVGTRYIENILGNFGVHSSDKRLQQPEFIVGITNPIAISEVLNTTGTDDLPQGNMAGHGVAFTNGHYGNYFCEEHGFIIGVMSVMPVTAYEQGLTRHWLKIDDPTDYAFPIFAHLGEMAVSREEIYAFDPPYDEPFGYLPQYSDYRTTPSRVAAFMRNGILQSLGYWHSGRFFPDTTPLLNQEFIDCDATTRIFAVQDPDVHHMVMHVLNSVSALRPLPKFGTPGGV